MPSEQIGTYIAPEVEPEGQAASVETASEASVHRVEKKLRKIKR
jgi:hypothetical protein